MVTPLLTRRDLIRPRSGRRRLAIVVSHPVQYYAPWFAYLTRHLDMGLRVFYLWNFGVTRQHDPGFGQPLHWDVDLLAGYDHLFLPNRSRLPGTERLYGLDNPSLPDALRAWAPDALLVFGYRSWSHLKLIFSHDPRVPMLFRGDSHLLAEERGPLARAAKRVLLARIFRQFEGFLSVGRANADYFRAHGVPAERLFHAPHAIDQARFATADQVAAQAWKAELGIPSQHRVILFAGKFEAKKRPDDLVTAFRRAALPATTLLFVGAGPLENRLREMSAGEPPIRFAPFQNQSAMPRTLAAADLVVLPSAGPGETWGLIINEALAVGRAVLVSDHVGCHPELVEPGRNGLVFPARDIRALTSALWEAVGTPGQLAAWGRRSRAIAERNTYRETTAGLIRALDSLTLPFR